MNCLPDRSAALRWDPLTQTLAAAPRIVFIISGITRASDQAFGKAKMDARLGRRDSTQARRSDGGSGIDMKLLWENRRKYAHESQSDALPEARFISFAADKAGSNYGK